MARHSPLVEHVYFNPPAPQEAESWWARYKAQLAGLTDTARAAVEADSRYILQRGILAADTAKPDEWSFRRSRTGLVMGSVQSGKTASMLGVSALAIDNGLDIIVVLAGTRLSLWRQTYERLLQQLDSGEENAQKVKRRLLCPAPGIALSEQTHSLTTTYRLSSAQVRKRLRQRKPLIIVAMKQADHLHALGASLRDNFFKEVEQLGRPVHMLVLDDEADDGSILDAIVESSQDPIYGNLKQIPRAIANLWDPPQGSPENLFSTYIAYTASFAIATGGVLTLFIAAPPNGSSVWVRVVDEVSGAVFEQETTADLPATTQFLSPRLFLNNGATAAAVAYDCSGVYVETDY